jgi:hypothetical protein
MEEKNPIAPPLPFLRKPTHPRSTVTSTSLRATNTAKRLDFWWRAEADSKQLVPFLEEGKEEELR